MLVRDIGFRFALDVGTRNVNLHVRKYISTFTCSVVIVTGLKVD